MNNNNSSQDSSPTADFKHRRQALGLTQAQLAARARCSITTLYNIETGVTRKGIARDKIHRVLTELEAA